ncbi:MAG TPA: putative glycoside hydrolase [Gemmatimonadaceae bacterium]|nr:putative glycoside hydrolase [Gemmatimonadaceae bacterium]
MTRRSLSVVRPLLPLVVALLGGCTAASEHAGAEARAQGGSAGAGGSTGAAAVATADSASRAAATVSESAGVDDTSAAAVTTGSNRTVAPIDVAKEFPYIRALYVNRWAAQSPKRMRQIIQIADETEINGLVIDMKDEFGLNYHPSNPTWARNAGNAGVVRNLPALLDTLRAHHILPIARIVVFKDSVTARVHPEWTIRQKDGSIWRDKKGLAWVNPYHHELWQYNIGIAQELAKMGFGEIQFDYIRFPEPYPSLPTQVFPEQNGVAKPDVLANFLKNANARLDSVGARTTADIFGLVTTVGGPLEVGQWWEKLAPVTDVLLPMVYPSHYPSGSFGIKRPNAEPYEIVKTALTRAHERNAKLGITEIGHVRPYLQAFSLGAPHYGPEQILAQKKATYDSGFDGWVLWSPGSKYEEFVPALEKTLESRRATLSMKK